MKEPRQVLKTLLISEKALMSREKNNDYIFEVRKDANKIEVRNAVEKLYNVKVIKVTTLNNPGKQRRMGRYRPGFTSEWKKAIVKLAKDSKIAEFESL